MKKLLQEILDLEQYKDCLSKDLYKVYKEHLYEKILNKVTARSVAETFRLVFDKNEIESPDTTINVLKKLKNVAQRFKYERKFGKIIPSEPTHLQSNSGRFCNKSVFKKEFEKEDFSEFNTKEDLIVENLVRSLLNGYLEMYDEDGWLILKDDGCEEIKDA